MSENKLTEFKKISSKKLLIDYLTSEAIKHTYYKIYTKYNRAENIINSHSIYLTDGKNWNDIQDKNILNQESDNQKNFAVCFSCRQSEDVSMWMLYAGKKDGCLIDLKRDLIKDLLNPDKIALGYFEENEEFKLVKTLDKNSFNIYFQDIVYYKKDEKSYNLKHPGDNINQNFNNIDFLNCFRKKRPWLYENECRLVVTIDKRFLSDEISAIKIEFNKNFINSDKIRLYKSPIYKNANENYEKSILEGEIDWDLCYECPNKNNYQYK